MSDVLAWFDGLSLWTAFVTAADVAIVAFIIYRILLLLRGTGAAYMLVGLLAVAGAFLVARKLSLTTVSWILDHVITYFILIVIIVFQADIRRGLMRVGRRLFLFSHPSMAAEDVDDVVQVCQQMAIGRVGALVIFEREADLSQFIDQSVELEARVTPALLHNIFAPWPDNPLHDGAVVIKNNWIRKAAAVLPLSANQQMDPRLGTRHRAAVGITEETDAVAVVVSEQRGAIGLCVAGRLRLNLSPDELHAELVRFLAVPGSSRWQFVGRWLSRLERTLVRRSDEQPRLPRRRPPRTEELLVEAIRHENASSRPEKPAPPLSREHDPPVGGAST